ncbi:MAG: dTMP kinase [Alphaproteobacteria bacterium]|nr:dTMP kinase [Alphaproteobacteria bacterium]
MTRGRLITIEGGEGTGKSTQARLLGEHLAQSGLDPLVTREPGGTPAAEELRRLLVEGGAHWTVMSEALLHYAARCEHIERRVRPALDAGRWVVCDRFSDSTMAYQGYGLGLGRRVVERLHRLVLGDFVPDLTIVLDLPVEVGLARAVHRAGGAGRSRYEAMDVAFHERLRVAFLEIARRAPARCVVVDASNEAASIQAAIRAAMRTRLGR